MQLSMAEFFECLLVLQLNLNTTKFKVPETYMFTYSAISWRGTSVNFEDMCSSKGLKTWTYLRMKLMKIGPHLRPTPWKLHSVQGKKLRRAWMLQLYFVCMAPSTRIRFQTKTELFCSGYGNRSHYNTANDHRKRSHSKTRSRVERSENDAF